MNSIEIVLSLTSPLYVAYPGGYDDTNKISRTAKLRIHSEGQILNVPYFPANGFRGSLRRYAMQHLVKHFSANEGRIPGDLYLGLSCGASTGNPDTGTPISIEELLRARNNVYMGLFGGGARLHTSAYRVSDMIPVLAATLKTGMVPKRLQELVKERPSKTDGQASSHVAPWEVVGQRTSFRRDDLFSVSNPEDILTHIKDPKVTVAAHQDAVLNSKGADKKTDVNNMLTYETVAPGVPFYFRVDLDNEIDEAKIGLMLLCLTDLFKENAFGGWTRCGFGKVHVDALTVNLYGENSPFLNLHDDNDTFILPKELSHFVDAAHQAISGLAIDDLTGFFEDLSADKKAAKEKKTAKQD